MQKINISIIYKYYYNYNNLQRYNKIFHLPK